MSWIARRAGAVVRPTDERHMHHATMPLLGGLAMYVGVMVPTLALVKMSDASKAILIGGTIITLVGLVDDLLDIRPLLKFAGQLAAIGVMLYFDVRIARLNLPFSDETFTFHMAVSVALTVVWMGVVINMVNFIDGLDGLAAGVCAISAITFSVIALSLDRAPMGVEAAVLAGAAFAFLRFNFYPASIFMGDTGSMLLGYCLGVISVQGVLKGAATVALIFPLLVLGVPFVDFFRIVFHRWREGVPFYRGGKDHVHHHLVLVVGYSQRKAVLLLYGWCVLLSGLAVAMRERAVWAVVVLGAGSLIATVSMLRLLRRFRARSEEEVRREALGDEASAPGSGSAPPGRSAQTPCDGGGGTAPGTGDGGSGRV
jgi:UDP-GlcNAc:undecaprenyl-phosphate/decaprenyl-phosphate GlcNAc-1-phosphate transferase